MGSIGVELPPLSDEVALFLRILNTPLPEDEELRRKQLALHQQMRHCLNDATAYFVELDAYTVQQLLEERTAVTREAKDVLKKLDGVRNEGGYHTSRQPVVRADLEQAQRKADEFQPVNRTVAGISTACCVYRA
jgi:hypothetical protein